MTSNQGTPPRTFRKWRLIVPLALLVLVVLSVAAARSLTAWRLLSDDISELETMSGDDPADWAQPERLTELDSLLARTDQDRAAFASSLGPAVYMAPLFGWLPRYGGDFANAPALLDFAGQTMAAARSTLGIGLALNDDLGPSLTLGGKLGETIALSARAHSADIEQAQRQLKGAMAARSRIDVAQLSSTSQKWMIQFDQLSPQWQALLGNLAIAPPLLGADGPRVYLLLMQNDDELRATGGFITAVALLKVDHGQISLSNFEDSGEINGETALHPPPPAALEKFMFAHVWVLRDANWSPDFPAVANITQAMYRIDRHVSMDGVIAVNLGLVPKLVDVWGPITLAGTNQPVDARNVIAELESYRSETYDGGHRKAILLNLLQEIVRRISTGNFDRARLARVLYDSMMAKDLLIHVNDVTLNQHMPGWQSGALYTGPEDALMIVDSNVGWNKVDRSVERRAEYVVSIDESNQVTASLTINYANLSAAAKDTCLHRPQFGVAYEELQQGCYYDYLRIVAPGGSELLGPSEGLETTDEMPVEGRAVFGGYFVIPRGQSRTVHFDYLLPPILPTSSSYTLHLEKQPGSSSIPVRVRITLPETRHLLSARPLPVRFQDHAAEFDLTLDRDQTIVLDISSPQPSAWAILFASLAAVGLLLGVLNRRNHRRRLMN